MMRRNLHSNEHAVKGQSSETQQKMNKGRFNKTKKKRKIKELPQVFEGC